MIIFLGVSLVYHCSQLKTRFLLFSNSENVCGTHLYQADSTLVTKKTVKQSESAMVRGCFSWAKGKGYIFFLLKNQTMSAKHYIIHLEEKLLLQYRIYESEILMQTRHRATGRNWSWNGFRIKLLTCWNGEATVLI